MQRTKTTHNDWMHVSGAGGVEPGGRESGGERCCGEERREREREGRERKERVHENILGEKKFPKIFFASFFGDFAEN